MTAQPASLSWVRGLTQHSTAARALTQRDGALRPLSAGEMLHLAEPFLEQNIHPTVVVRGACAAVVVCVQLQSHTRMSALCRLHARPGGRHGHHRQDCVPHRHKQPCVQLSWMSELNASFLTLVMDHAQTRRC